MEQAGHECVGFCEFDKFAVASYTSMHLITEDQRECLATLSLKERQKEILKEEYRNGEWYCGDIRTIRADEIPEADCWCFGAPCFVAGTLINTDRGLISIEDIKVGDYVLTHKNRYRKVLKKMRSVKKGISTIKVSGSPETICTNNHRFYVRYRNRIWDSSLKKYIASWTEPEWKSVSEFNGKEYILFPHNTERENPLQLSKQECWIIGRYVADGNLQISKQKQGYKRTAFCIGNKKIPEFLQMTEGIKFSKKEKQGCASYTTYNKKVFEICSSCGRNAQEKHFPQFVMNLPEDLMECVLDGYMSGDGCITNGWYQAITISKQLAYQIEEMVIKIYHNPSIMSFIKRKQHKINFDGKEYETKDFYHIRFHKDYRKLARGYYVDDDLWMKLKHFEFDSQREEIVFNLEVEEDNSYCANMLAAHNCQDFSQAGLRKGMQGDRSSLIREVFRLLRETKSKPEWILYENVRGMLSSNRGYDFLYILSEMAALGYDIEYELLNSKYYGVPQNRERVYTIGHLRAKGSAKVFPIKGTDGEDRLEIIQIGSMRENDSFGAGKERIINPDGLSPCIRGTDYKEPVRTGIPLGVIHPRGRVGFKCEPQDIVPTLTSEHHSHQPEIVLPCLTPDRANKRQNGRRFKDSGEDMFTLTAQDIHGIGIGVDIPESDHPGMYVELEGGVTAYAVWEEKEQCYIVVRKLTPREYGRLQSFPDEMIDKAQFVNSDSQLYKQFGNSVTVNIVYEIAKRMKEVII